MSQHMKRTITLNPNTSGTVSFSVQPTHAGTYNVKVTGQQQSLSGSFGVSEYADPVEVTGFTFQLPDNEATFFDPITGRLTWKNNTIKPGDFSYLWAGFMLGKDPNYWVFTLDEYPGVEWIAGSIDQITIPSPGTERTDNIQSRAVWYIGDDDHIYDAVAFIGVPLAAGWPTKLEFENRIALIDDNDFFAKIGIIDFKWFHDVLKITAPLVPAEVVGYSFVEL